jgi:hypothetical protein
MVHGDINDGGAAEPMPVSTAYSSAPASSSSRFAIVAAVLILLIVIKNVMFVDYTNETKSYLTKIGRADAIENVVPKTASDVRREKFEQQVTIDQLVANVTALTRDNEQMKRDIHDIKLLLEDKSKEHSVAGGGTQSTQPNQPKSSTTDGSSTRPRAKLRTL